MLVGHSHVALASRCAAATSRAVSRPTGRRSASATRRWLINPGSVGQPRDGDPRAAWLELDQDAGTAVFHRVEYDIARTQAEIVAAGLPAALAQRLSHGL